MKGQLYTHCAKNAKYEYCCQDSHICFRSFRLPSDIHSRQGAYFIEPMGNNVVLLLDKWGFPALITRKFAATKLVTVLIFGIFCPQGLPRPWFRPFCAEAIHCCRLISSLKEDAHAVHNDFGW